MTDAWEILGRMLTDKKFRKSVFRVAPTKRPCVNRATRAKFDEKDYEDLRKVVRRFIPRPISLMGLGEMLWPLAGDSFRNHVEAIVKVIRWTGIRTERENHYFYVALAAMVVDAKLRTKLTGPVDSKDWDRFGYSSLSHEDRKALVDLFFWLPPNSGVTTLTPLQKASEDLCDDDWTDDCFIRTIFLEYPTGVHTHPVPLLGPPTPKAKLKALPKGAQAKIDATSSCRG
jgi:hypothetical protein